MGERFARGARLLKRAEFDAVFASEHRISSRWITAHYLQNPVGHPRLGFAISAKALSGAVERNRVKRLLRDGFRRQAHSLPALDLVIRVRPGIKQVENPALRADIESLWRRLPALSTGFSNDAASDPQPPRQG